METPNALKQYLDKQRISCGALAREVGVVPSQISRLAAGTRRLMGVTLAVEIERATAGAVPVESWVNRRQNKRAPSGKTRKPPRRTA